MTTRLTAHDDIYRRTATECADCGYPLQWSDSGSRCKPCRNLRRLEQRAAKPKRECRAEGCTRTVRTRHGALCDSCMKENRRSEMREAGAALELMRPWNAVVARQTPRGPARWGRSP